MGEDGGSANVQSVLHERLLRMSLFNSPSSLLEGFILQRRLFAELSSIGEIA